MNDTSQTYNHELRLRLEELIREKAVEAKRAGNPKKAKEFLKGIDDLEAVRGW
jgi:hypothetical protein